MHIINLTPITQGVYNDHNADHITCPPEGWAYIPEDFILPSTFPRLGSIKAEEKTYTREVEVNKPITKTREVDSYDIEGKPITITEEYTENEIVTETVEYTMLTVVEMTEGTMPEPKPEVPSQLDQIEAQVTYTAMMTDTLLEV
ncbi:MAG: hypothetical protein IKT32_02710 [Clostridia bacterium]|nr:hypothetical protein [Clostridia bacterium]